MSLYTNPSVVEKIKAACRAAATVLKRTAEKIRPGISTLELDQYAKTVMEELECTSACYLYPSAKKGVAPFPGYICVSINDEIVHGIPSAKRILKEGDIITLDLAVIKDGYVGDNARTYGVGKISKEAQELLRVTEESLMKGIEKATRGNRVGDISHAVQAHVEAAGFSAIREFVGHGVGREMHEEPQVPNFGKAGTGDELKVGMVLALEPMINQGKKEIKIDADGWTVRTADGSLSAHFEHTVMITAKGPRVLTEA